MLTEAGRVVMTTTIDEAYFLIRVGTWGPSDLEDWVEAAASRAEDTAYDSGYADGHKEGWEEGQEDLQKQALRAIRDLL